MVGSCLCIFGCKHDQGVSSLPANIGASLLQFAAPTVRSQSWKTTRMSGAGIRHLSHSYGALIQPSPQREKAVRLLIEPATKGKVILNAAILS